MKVGRQRSIATCKPISEPILGRSPLSPNPANQPDIRQFVAPDSDSSRDGEDELRLITVANILLRHRVGIAVFAILLSVAAVLFAAFSPRLYTSNASFLPQGGQPSSPRSGLAAQLGVDLSGSNQGASPAFYADLARTRQVLGAVVGARYRLSDGRQAITGTLVEFFRAPGDDSAHRRDAAIRKLEQALTVTFDARTSVVTVSVKTANAELTRQVADSLLAAVSQFNLERRQSQAGEERRFTEARLAEVRADLRRAEDELQVFLQRNRMLGAADLDAQRDRLVREVSLRQQVYSTLTDAYERAKLEEVRDTPVITVVQSPEAALRADSRRVLTKGVLTFLIGLFLASLVAVLGDRLGRHERLAPNELEQFGELKRSAVGDLKHPLRAMRRWISRAESREPHTNSAVSDTQRAAL